MPLPQRWNNAVLNSSSSSKRSSSKKRGRMKNNNNKGNTPPDGLEYVEPVLEALEHELRDVVQEQDAKKRKTEAMWPIHQLNWQKSRYIYDLYYIHRRISKAVYQYCLDQKWVDALLMAKWKKPGYERLCSLYVIDGRNYKFGTTSICRVPWKDRSESQQGVADPTTGCLGCFSGPQALSNIFGNKYGQYLAAIQIAREERTALKQQQLLLKQQEQEEEDDDDDENNGHGNDDDSDSDVGPQPASEQQQPQVQLLSTETTKRTEEKKTNDDQDDAAGDAPTDDDETDDEEDDDDFGPSPAAGIWAGSQKLEHQSQQLTYPNQDATTTLTTTTNAAVHHPEEGEDDDETRPQKMAKNNEG